MNNRFTRGHEVYKYNFLLHENVHRRHAIRLDRDETNGPGEMESFEAGGAGIKQKYRPEPFGQENDARSKRRMSGGSRSGNVRAAFVSVSILAQDEPN